MNNYRLLKGLCVTAFLSAAVHSYGSTATVISIERLFEIAETNSVKLRPSFTAQEEAKRELNVAKSHKLPDINIDLSLSYIGDGFTTRRDFTDYQKAPIPHLGNTIGINVTQPVYTGGAITTGIEIAELKSCAARFAADMARDNIRFSLAGSYLDIYKCANLRQVVEQNLLLARKMLKEMETRYEHGVALRNDITRYELLISNLELQLIKIDNTLEILNNNLVVTAGLPADTQIVPDSTILSRSLPAASEQQWQQNAADCSPALMMARTAVDLSRKSEAMVKCERLPKIGLQAGWVLDGPILVEVPPINRDLSYWYVGVGVSYNLSSIYKSNKSLAKSRVATRKAIEELDALREDVRLAVNADYVKYLESYEELKTQEKSVELAERNYNITATRYSADMALITDLLDAVNSKLDAEQQLVNARINIIYYYYKLLFTTGKI